MPDYLQIERDPQWRRWMTTVEPLSGRQMGALLNDAIARGDAPRVINIYRGFSQQRTSGGQQQRTSGGHASGRARAAPQKPTYTPDRIRELYEQRRRGTYKGGEAEWARQEADIYAAAREGRVLAPPYLTK